MPPSPSRTPLAVGRQAFGAVSIALHWLVAAGIVGMLAFGMVIGAMESGREKTDAIQVHKSFGIVVGLLAVMRLMWRAREGFPHPVQGLPNWERLAARRMHELLLALTMLMPVTGILKSVTYARPVDVFGVPLIPKLLAEKNVPLNEIVSSAHAVSGYLLAALVVLHVAAALKHHLVDRDATLSRMLKAN
jgi:cytochrome b561